MFNVRKLNGILVHAVSHRFCMCGSCEFDVYGPYKLEDAKLLAKENRGHVETYYVEKMDDGKFAVFTSCDLEGLYDTREEFNKDGWNSME